MIFDKIYHIKNLPDLKNYEKIEIKQWFLTNENDSVINSVICYNNNKYKFCFDNHSEIIKYDTNKKKCKKIIEYKPYLLKDEYIIKNNKDVKMSIHIYKENLKGLKILKYYGKTTNGLNEVFNWVPSWEWVGEEIKSNIDFSELKLSKKNMINKKDVNKLYSIVDEVLRNDLRKEAKKIVDNMNDEQSSSVIMYYNGENFNAVCMEFDRIKKELVVNNVMKQNENDEFGEFFN